MGQNRKSNFLVILVLLGVIFAFAYSYNATVTTTVANAAYNDRTILQSYNSEIVAKLTEEESVSAWQDIVDQYEDIVIVIENSANKVVTKTLGRTWTALDVKVQTPFEYHGEAYVIKSSVYLLRDYVADVRIMVRFIFIEFLIGISALLLLIFIIYTIMLKPYKRVYKVIEEYDKTGKLPSAQLKGFAGRVYSRFVSLTENLELQQQNQKRIIASISHDIKTPLTSIMGYAERLKKEGISEERRERYLDTVYMKSVEIRELVDEFDEYLSFDNHMEIKAHSLSCSELCRIITEEYADELDSEGVTFSMKNSAGNAQALFDIQKIKRVFGNVIGNSLKHFTSDDKEIFTAVSCDRERIYIDISDSGDGVEKDKLDMIFEPLYTSDEGRKVAGLGLSICREIIEGHGGRISAAPSDMGGLKISIELPRSDRKKRGKI